MADTSGLSRRAQWAHSEPIANILMAQALAHPELVSLAAGFVDHESLPAGPVQKALEILWSDPAKARSALQYGTTIGYPPLREAIAARLMAADRHCGEATRCEVERVVMTAGSNQLLHLVADVLLDPGDIVLCASPTYYVFLGTLTNVGATAVGVATDRQGIIPEALDEELARRNAAGELARVKAIYVTSYYDNPAGVTLPTLRRAAVVDVARRWSRRRLIYVIDDAAYRELRYSGDDVPSMLAFDPEGDLVIHAGSFSKSFSPGVRVGWGVLPRSLLTPVLAEKGNIDFGSPNFNQMLMATIVENGWFDEHVQRLCAVYRVKRDALIAAVDQQVSLAAPGPSAAGRGDAVGVRYERPEGGLYVWLELPPQVDTGLTGRLFPAAVEAGVLYVPGACCYPGPRSAPGNMLRLSFASPSLADLRRGAAALGKALREVMS